MQGDAFKFFYILLVKIKNKKTKKKKKKKKKEAVQRDAFKLLCYFKLT